MHGSAESGGVSGSSWAFVPQILSSKYCHSVLAIKPLKKLVIRHGLWSGLLGSLSETVGAKIIGLRENNANVFHIAKYIVLTQSCLKKHFCNLFSVHHPNFRQMTCLSKVQQLKTCSCKQSSVYIVILIARV